MNKTNPKVDEYLRKAKKWQEEIEKLRTILLDSQLTEEFKWGKPCYTFQGSNVVLILPLKEHCVLLFTKGALLKDPNGILIAPTENTQAARQLRLTSAGQIGEMEAFLKAYIQEATEVEKAGLKVDFKKIEEFAIPEELQNKFGELPALKNGLRSIDARTAKGLPASFFGAQTIQDSGVED